MFVYCECFHQPALFLCVPKSGKKGRKSGDEGARKGRAETRCTIYKININSPRSTHFRSSPFFPLRLPSDRISRRSPSVLISLKTNTILFHLRGRRARVLPRRSLPCAHNESQAGKKPNRKKREFAEVISEIILSLARSSPASSSAMLTLISLFYLISFTRAVGNSAQ